MEVRSTERRNPDTQNIDRLSAIEIMKVINREDHKVAASFEMAVAWFAYNQMLL